MQLHHPHKPKPLRQVAKSDWRRQLDVHYHLTRKYIYYRTGHCILKLCNVQAWVLPKELEEIKLAGSTDDPIQMIHANSIIQIRHYYC